ncbi:MAG: hypothetical protein A2015_12730 [Spirochaetes bacterium GWF1_31_7]|nr:MAG: hypothetical protein A2Y30_10520 [Spirochaetes bacterium GWE1_32_154]OHD49247.1 MAG: hypothetical protein A2Y29_16150 [Spirochaetes bacterium GWE2_31_10]OHD51809.1 MAG: hypothetical protein A2015_12730 [Spirochaetes bacterium GWF1_31_7]HBD95333.1 hypothetical protein [Spirochaetia bacterium]HBI39157.1 hypothetical protein [Spirochaetia bacterium]
MRKAVIIFGMIFFAITLFCSSKMEVIYPNRDGIGEQAFGYQLLKLILPKIDKEYSVKLAPESSNQDRALALLENGTYSVVDTGIGPDFENRFDAIYIPIDMGLTGWRIFIINKNQKNDFEKIKTLEQLRNKKAGQGTGWTDGLIIEKSGITVLTAPNVENLVLMVSGDRFDFFPLGVNETHGFLKEYGRDLPNLMVEETLVLAYPFARLFYVKKGNVNLHKDIQLGLEKSYGDGSFKKFIEEHPFFQEGLRKSDLKNRTIIRIDNPFMTEKFKKIDSKWWYKIE